MSSVVDCSKVSVKHSKHGLGSFAACPIAAGELVEIGVARRLTNVDGNENPYIFSWSKDRTVWATGSGCSMFYNTPSGDGVENVKMTRYFDEDRFEIHALRDIVEGEELTHVYVSIEWRNCFSDIKSSHKRIKCDDTEVSVADDKK